MLLPTYKQLQVIFNAKLLVDYVIILFARYLQIFRVAPTLIIGEGANIHIFVFCTTNFF